VTRLNELAIVIRSKNAGPYLLTFDIILVDRGSYERALASAALTPARLAETFRVPLADVLDVVGFAPANAIKVTLKRPVVSGSLADTDVYGAQQHVPLLDLEV
jgi:hypothetical protein